MNTVTKRFNRVHAICNVLRNKACERCPSREAFPPHGNGTRGCYMLAKEVLNIAVHGNPWGDKKRNSSGGVKRWRKRFNREHE